MYLPKKLLKEKLLHLLKEDLGLGDITSYYICGHERGRGIIFSKEPSKIVMAGIEEACLLGEALGLEVKAAVSDGALVTFGQTVLIYEGQARDILAIERTVLNLMMRMSAVATKTYNLQQKIRLSGSHARVAATRKTLPGFLYFDKKAVALGGGDTHRLHLEDMVLIKDNHIAIAGGIKEAIKRVKRKVSFSKKIEIEVSNQKQAIEAAQAGADIIMLDNFKVDEAKETLETMAKLGLRQNVLIEISGNINEDNLISYAQLQPDIISCGALTHSVKAVDFSLKLELI